MIQDISFGIIPLKKTSSGYEVLLIQHRNGSFWGFPKGHKDDPNESDQETAERELLEETGLKVKTFVSDEPYLEEYKFKKQGKLIHKKVFFYPAIVEGKFQKQHSEIYDGKWVDLQDAPEALTYPEAKKVCLTLIKTLGLPGF